MHYRIGYHICSLLLIVEMRGRPQLLVETAGDQRDFDVRIRLKEYSTLQIGGVQV